MNVLDETAKEDIATLESLFDLLKAEFFSGEESKDFVRPLITINYNLKRMYRITGKKIVSKVTLDSIKPTRVLDISMQLLKKPIVEISMHLVIVMLHLEDENKYFARNGYYKKKAYYNKLKEFGIECEKDSKNGYAEEKPGDRFAERLSQYKLDRYRFVCLVKQKVKQPEQRSYMYECPECHAKVRGSRKDMNIICGEIKEHPQEHPFVTMIYDDKKKEKQ